MPVTVKLPDRKKKKEYSLYVSGKIERLVRDPELGTLIVAEGCGVAFYSASNSRRAVVFSELSEDDCGIPLMEGSLPYFKQRVRIIYRARGRKIDLLKYAVYNLEKRYGKQIYSLGTLYWQTLSSFIDSVRKEKGKPERYSRQVYLITERFLSREKADENLQGHP